MAPGNGVVVLAAWGYTPSPIKTGHVTLTVDTSTCSLTVASQKKHVRMGAKQGFSVGALERALDAYWSKFVVLLR